MSKVMTIQERLAMLKAEQEQVQNKSSNDLQARLAGLVKQEETNGNISQARPATLTPSQESPLDRLNRLKQAAKDKQPVKVELKPKQETPNEHRTRIAEQTIQEQLQAKVDECQAIIRDLEDELDEDRQKINRRDERIRQLEAIVQLDKERRAEVETRIARLEGML